MPEIAAAAYPLHRFAVPLPLRGEEFYRPSNFGVRFSRKAAPPSRTSWLGLVIITESCASSSEDSNVEVSARRIIILAVRTASGAWADSASQKVEGGPREIILDQLGDQAELVGAAGVVDLVQQRHPERPVVAHHVREEPRAAFVGQQAEAAGGVAHPRRQVGEAEVAGQRQREAAGHREAAHHRHRRLVDLAQHRQHRLHAVAHLAAVAHR